MAVTNPWLGDWQSQSEDGSFFLRAHVSREGPPTASTGCVFALGDQCWVFRNLVWLLDPLGIEPDIQERTGLDEGLLTFALNRQSEVLSLLGLDGLAFDARGLPQDMPDSNWVHVSLQLGSSETEIVYSLDAWTTEAGAKNWLGATQMQRRRQPSHWLRDLDVPLRWVLPPFSMPLNQMHHLNVGNVIQMGLPAHRSSFVCLQGTNYKIQLRASDATSSWIITAILLFPENAATGEIMTPDTDDLYSEPSPEPEFSEMAPNEEPQNTLNFNDLNIPVSVLCGRVNVPLRELHTWSPGTEVSLTTTDPDEVTLCSGDRVLARGRLVRLNDQLAVRITGVVP